MKQVFKTAIRIYQYCVSPFLGCRCRFAPSCSDYVHQAITQHGVFRGIILGICRLARCHPWGGSGYEPVPQEIKIPFIK